MAHDNHHVVCRSRKAQRVGTPSAIVKFMLNGVLWRAHIIQVLCYNSSILLELRALDLEVGLPSIEVLSLLLEVGRMAD